MGALPRGERFDGSGSVKGAREEGAAQAVFTRFRPEAFAR